jgi:hypothetical protein
MSDCYYDAAGCLVCPEKAAQPFVPSRIERRAVLGWNAGANSIAVLDGDLHVVFDLPLGAVGTIMGLKGNRKQPTIPSLIEHGWYFQKVGGVDLVRPIERGVASGSQITGRTSTTLFEIRRVNGKVTYLMNGAVVRTSATPSHGAKVVNCCLYASGDGAPSGA